MGRENARRAVVPGTGDARRHRMRRSSNPPRRTVYAAPWATFRRVGTIQTFRDKIRRQYEQPAAIRREYSPKSLLSSDRGASANMAFPESHAASFALLVYASALDQMSLSRKSSACALLNSQPMGFYAPAADRARCRRTWRGHPRRGCELLELGLHAGNPLRLLRGRLHRPLCGYAKATSEPTQCHAPGFAPDRGVPEERGQRASRRLGVGAFSSLREFWLRTELSIGTLETVWPRPTLSFRWVSTGAKRYGNWRRGLRSHGRQGRFCRCSRLCALFCPR